MKSNKVPSEDGIVTEAQEVWSIKQNTRLDYSNYVDN